MAVDGSRIQKFVGQESSSIRALDAVSKSDIRHWCELVGDADPGYAEAIKKGEKPAPPTMTLVWAMPALWPPKPDATEPHEQLARVLSEGGYPDEIGVALEQVFVRPIRIGDRLSYKVKVEDVSSTETETKQGRGYLIDLLYTFENQKGELVGHQKCSVLRFAKLTPPARPSGAKEA